MNPGFLELNNLLLPVNLTWRSNIKRSDRAVEKFQQKAIFHNVGKSLVRYRLILFIHIQWSIRAIKANLDEFEKVHISLVYLKHSSFESFPISFIFVWSLNSLIISSWECCVYFYKTNGYHGTFFILELMTFTERCVQTRLNLELL